METRRTVSIKDVAKAANVSLATVSRVINNSDNVKPKMRELVQDTIRELGYSPNHAERSLVKRKTNCMKNIDKKINFCYTMMVEK